MSFSHVLRILGGALLALAMGLGMAPANSASAQAAPSISFVNLKDGQTVTGERLAVWVNVTGLKLDGTKIGTDPVTGVGHWHLSVDGKYAGLSVSNVIGLPNDAFPEVSAGTHDIKLDLHNNNHTPIPGAGEQTIKVNFANAMKYAPAAGSPGIKIADVSTVGDWTLVQVQVTGLKQDGTKIGTAPTDGVGHWHLSVDGKYAGLSVSDLISIPNDATGAITPGAHDLLVDLHNNNHTPIAGATSDKRAVSVGPASLPKTGDNTTMFAVLAAGLGAVFLVAGYGLRRRRASL